MSDLWADDEAAKVVRNTDPKRYCMAHMAQYGSYKDKDTGIKQWTLKAQRMAYWIITSSKHNPGTERAYCLDCINELENIDGTPYPIQDQLRDGAKLDDAWWKLSTPLHTLGDN